MPTPTQTRKRKKNEYGAYLGSTQWRRLREEVLERDGHACTKCGAGSGLQVHHITYERIFNEELEDLLTLCARCHKAEHEPSKKKKRGRKAKQANRKRPLVGICRACGTKMERPYWQPGGGFYCGSGCRRFRKAAQLFA